jgi:hypothetical protein
MLIEKSRSGVYQDTSENRRLHRVGQKYGKVAQKEEDFESFADRYEKEYRKKHSGSPVKNSEIRYEASKAWDKMHSSENRRLHHVGQKYGGAKKDEAKVDYKDVKSVADFLLDKFNIYSKTENYSEVSPTYLKLNKGVEIRFSPKKESERVGKVFYSSSQFDNEPVFVTILASFDKYPELKKLFDKLSSTNLKEATDGKTAQWGTWKFAIRSKEDLKKFGEIYNQVFNKKKAVLESGVKKGEMKQVEKVSSKVEEQPVKENAEKQDKQISRVTFADVPRSREVNLKKYLTDSRRKQVDHLMKAAEVMPKSTVKQMHDAAVKKFNDNFDNLKKSERASALYVIMKYKDFMNKAKSSPDRNKVAREDIVKRMSDAKVSFGSIEQILREGAEKKSGDSGAVKGDIEVDLSGSYNDHAWKSSGRSKPKKTYQLILHTDADAGAFNRGTLTRDQIKGVTLVESNPWEGFYVKIKDMDLDDLPVRADRK